MPVMIGINSKKNHFVDNISIARSAIKNKAKQFMSEPKFVCQSWIWVKNLLITSVIV